MIEPGSPEFPAAKDDDDDDVAWALSTAAVQWKRGSRADAVVWLRRAVDNAVAVGATWRAAELTRQTDELESFLVDGLLAGPETEVAPEAQLEDDEMIGEEAMSLPPDAELEDVVALSPDATDETTDVTPEDEQQLAAQAEEIEQLSDDEIEVDEVEEVEEEPPLPRFASEAPTGTFSDARLGGPGELDSFADAEPDTLSELEPEPDTVSEPEPHYSAESDEEPELTPVHSSRADGAIVAAPAAQPEPEPEPEPEPRVAGILLSEITGFEDFPPETQVALARAARVERLSIDDEVSSFGLALVLRGAVSVMPAIADVVCGAAGERELVYGRGTLEEGVALRLVATIPDTQVAVWDLETIEPPLADCPWVLEELQTVADKYQALAGVSMGPMGDRLDDSLRGMVLSRCTLVRLRPGEMLVEQGKPVGGLFIVGAGRIELGSDAASAGSEGELGPGDFLFAPQVLAAGKAPTSAWAGATGALLMTADRHAAHELMLSVPPLLELLAG